MPKYYKILIVEDVESDILLIEYQLKKAFFKYVKKVVHTKIDFEDALLTYNPDIILADYFLNECKGDEILQIALNLRPNTPFIFVTGYLEESLAVSFIKKGAWDYILKENYVRLLPAIENVLKLQNERLKVNFALKISNEAKSKYEDLYENAPEMYFTFYFNTGIISECNKTLSDKLEIPKSKILNKHINSFNNENTIEQIKQKYAKTLIEKGRVENGNIQIITKENKVIYGQFTAIAKYNERGLVESVRMSVRDNTELVKKEKALKESQEQFKLIYDKSSDAILILDAEKDKNPIILQTNNSAKNYFGENFINKPISKLISHISEKEIIENVNEVLKGTSVRTKITLNLKENETYYFDVIANLIKLNNKNHILITARDITEKHINDIKILKQKENFQTLYEEYLSQNENLEDTIKQLYKSQKSLSNKIGIINRSPVIAFLWDNKPGWPVKYVSNNVKQIFGWSVNDFANNSIFYEEIIHPDDLANVKKEIETSKKNKISHKIYRIITKDKKIKWVKDDTVIIRKNGEIKNYEGIITDVTENVKYQKEIKESEKKYRSILDADPDIVLITSKDKKIHYMNSAAVNKFGNQEEKATCHKELFGLKEPCEWCGHNYLGNYKQIQNEVTLPEDNKRYLMTFSQVHKNNGQSTYMTSYKDVTELRQLQTERLQFLNALEVGLNEVYLLNPNNFEIKYINNKPIENTGFSKSEIINKKLYDFQINQKAKSYKSYFKTLKASKLPEINFETVQKRKNGTSYPVSVHLKLIKSGNTETLLAFVNDITEKNKQEEQLKLLSTAINQSQVNVVITDADGSIEYANPKFYETTGYLPTEIYGENCRILKSGEQSNDFYVELWDTITSGNVWKGEFHNKKKNGELYWESAIITPVKNKNGNIISYIALKEDITEQKIIREKLIESEIHFRLLFENSLIGMYLTSPDGQILNANKAFYTMLGFKSLDEIKKINLETDDDVVVNRKEFKNIIQKNGYVIGLESIWSNKNNELIYIRENARKYEDQNGNFFYEGTVENITKEKYAEKALREIHEFNKKIISVGELGYAIYDENGKCIDANEAAADILGTNISVLLKTNYKKNKNWKYFRLIEIAEKCLFDGTPAREIVQGESSYKKDVWLELNFSRLLRGNKSELLVIIKDISPYMNARRKQIQIKSEYINLIKNVNVPIFGLDSKHQIYEWNNALEKLTGYKRNEVKNKKVDAIFNIENNRNIINFLNQEQKQNIYNEEICIVGKKGNSIRLIISSTIQKNEKGKITGIIFIAQDITEREQYKVSLEKQVEERTHELIQSLKKEKALGELKSQFVSMASHEFRTPLSAISFASGFLEKYWNKIDERKRNLKLNKIETQVKHMTSLLDDILTYGKTEAGKIKFEPKHIDLIDFIKSIIEDVKIATRNSHKINFKFNNKTCEILLDEKIGRNIFINLISNAIKFSPNEEAVYVNLSSNNTMVNIEVMDKGIGISEKDLKTIFAPFQRGNNANTIQGTGLGLAIVKQSVDMMKGEIKIESEVGKGTSIIISLPKINNIKLN